MIYDIFTVCDKANSNAISMMIPSWLSDKSVGQVHVYTDFDYLTTNSRIRIYNVFGKDTPTYGARSRQARAFALFLGQHSEHIDTKYFAYLDIRCHMLDSIAYVFAQDFDIAVTGKRTKTGADSSVWFGQHCPDLYKFNVAWLQLQRLYMAKYANVKSINYAHEAFAAAIKNSHDLRIIDIDKAVFNSSETTVKWKRMLKANIDNGKYAKILRFQGKTWKIPKTFQSICKVARGA